MDITNMSIDDIREQVEQQIDFDRLEELNAHLEKDIRSILDSCGLYYRIFSRVKTKSSISKKLYNGKYGTAENPKKVQDLIGLRIVLYYSDDLSIGREIMEKTFLRTGTWSRNDFNAAEFRATKINGVFRLPSDHFKLYTSELWDLPIDKGGIANFHTLFNLTCTVLFLPFTGLLVKLATASVPAEETQEDPLAKLEPRFLTTPSLALDQAQRCIADMGDTAKQNFHLATDPLFGGAAANEEIFHEHEAFLDRAEVEIGRYLTTIHNIRSVDQRRQMAEMMHSLSDFEKIGDYAQNIFERADEFREAGLSFSPSAMQELRTMCEAVAEVLDMTVDGYDNQAVSTARMVEPLEEVVDTMKERLKSRHIERLGRNECTMQTGIHFLDIVHDLEKISDHCSNIAIYTIQLAEGAAEFDTHAYVKQAYKETPQFAEKLKFYQNKYLTKIDEVEAME